MEDPNHSGGLRRALALCFVPLPGIILLSILSSKSLWSYAIPLAFVLWMVCTTAATLLHCKERRSTNDRRPYPDGVIFFLYLAATLVVSFAIFFVGCLSSFHV
jgi:carbon starvation protein CstA